MYYLLTALNYFIFICSDISKLNVDILNDSELKTVHKMYKLINND